MVCFDGFVWRSLIFTFRMVKSQRNQTETVQKKTAESYQFGKIFSYVYLCRNSKIVKQFIITNYIKHNLQHYMISSSRNKYSVFNTYFNFIKCCILKLIYHYFSSLSTNLPVKLRFNCAKVDSEIKPLTLVLSIKCFT